MVCKGIKKEYECRSNEVRVAGWGCMWGCGGVAVWGVTV